jgi:hypothetical protein
MNKVEGISLLDPKIYYNYSNQDCWRDRQENRTTDTESQKYATDLFAF